MEYINTSRAFAAPFPFESIQKFFEPLRLYLTASFLILAAPVPTLAWMMFESGGFPDAVNSSLRWMGLWLLYWVPLGAFWSRWKRGKWTRFFLGYVISLPLFFIALDVVYPGFGGTFHPLLDGRWKIYLSATPTFYILAFLRFLFGSRRIGVWMVRASMLVFAAGVLYPIGVAAASAYDWPRISNRGLAIEGAHIVDASANRILDGQTVYVQDGRIVEFGPGSSHPEWPRLKANGYLVPGLIDVHTHLQSPVEVRPGFKFGYLMPSLLANYAPQRRAYLENGVTTVRDLGGPAVNAFKMRSEIQSKKTLGPRLLASGRLVTSPHGHPVSTIWDASVSRSSAILASDEETMLAGLDRNFADGPPDVVKFVHGTIGRAHEELSADLMSAGIRWAKAHGLTSVVHAETPQEFEDAIRAGADGVEHAAYLDRVPPELAALVSEKHPFIDPTFGEYETDLRMQKMPDREREAKLARSYQSVRILRQAGARIAMGTDAPMVDYGSGLHDEIAHFLHVGFEPSQILAIATKENAAYIGKSAELGQIAAGFRADLLLVRNNPLVDLETLRKPVWTMLDGQIVAHP